jgi:predicted amidohydrolase YtcJ
MIHRGWIRTSRRCAPALAALCIVGASCAQVPDALAPDAIYVNGTVLTMDKDGRVAEAVAVKGGRILMVGSNSDVRKVAGAATNVVDVAGKTLTPGFYAAHDHFPGSGMVAVTMVDLNSPPIGKTTTMQELVAALTARAAETPKGQWVVGRGYDDTLLKEMRHPTRADLDRASAEHPIWITHISGHLGVANSRALEIANVTRATPSPEGGVIRKDPKTGEPDGVFEEVGSIVGRHVPPVPDEKKWQGYEWANRDYVEEGVTTAVITGGNLQSVQDMQEAQSRQLVTFRIVSMTSKSNPGEPSVTEAGGLRPTSGGPMLQLGSLKIVHDGSIQGYTGYLSEPYHVPFKGDTSYRSYPRRSRDALTRMVTEAHRAGHQIAIHGNGAAAIDDIIHAFREAQRAYPRNDARHRIEHCQNVREDQLDQIKELDITPSFFVGHVYYWGDRHRDIFLGPERGARISPLASALKRGIRFTVHDDTPVTPVRPLQLVSVAATRLTTSGQVLGPDQRISVEQALRAITSEAAWQNFQENAKGSIEAGKLADLVILAENPLSVEPVKIRDIQVLETIVGGKTVFKRNGTS